MKFSNPFKKTPMQRVKKALRGDAAQAVGAVVGAVVVADLFSNALPSLYMKGRAMYRWARERGAQSPQAPKRAPWARGTEEAAVG